MTKETARQPQHHSESGNADRLHQGVCASAELAPYCSHVRELVSAERFGHIERVTETAVAIAEANGLSQVDRDRIALAAILHDAARDLPDEELLRLGQPVDEFEASHPLTLHGRASKQLAATWGVTDQVVLEAIDGHVFGVPLGHRVGMCVYVADVCEPGRGVNDDLRELAMHDLESAYRRAVASKVEYLRDAGKAIHPDTLSVFHSLNAEPT